MASEFAELVASTGCRKLLNDLRSACITHSAFDMYRMPDIDMAAALEWLEEGTIPPDKADAREMDC
ncbi:MAG: hypothetical protein ACOY90_05995 [Candidatus Zhuqueibacterota bacterium]